MQDVPMLQTGEVVAFDNEGGYGFVRDTLTHVDLFFHVNEVGTLTSKQPDRFTLTSDGYYEHRPMVGDRLVYVADLNYKKGPRATVWIDERSYRQQLRWIKHQWAAEAAAVESYNIFSISSLHQVGATM